MFINHLYSHLYKSAEKCLELIFRSLSMLHDYPKYRKYASPCEKLYIDTVSVSKTNSVAGRNFWMLDRLIREKPNAN